LEDDMTICQVYLVDAEVGCGGDQDGWSQPAGGRKQLARQVKHGGCFASSANQSQAGRLV
jgi:hypothetical protein